MVINASYLCHFKGTKGEATKQELSLLVPGNFELKAFHNFCTCDKAKRHFAG